MVVAVFASKSKAGADAAEWSGRFERYAATSGRPMRILPVNTRSGEWAAALPLSDELAVLWDASDRVPPKEIESLTEGLPAGAWRFAVRFAGSPPARGVGAAGRSLGKIWGRIRALCGGISDPKPPAVVLPCADLKRVVPVLAGLPAERWTSALLAQARREGRRALETPVMWAS